MVQEELYSLHNDIKFNQSKANIIYKDNFNQFLKCFLTEELYTLWEKQNINIKLNDLGLNTHLKNKIKI